jgi:hypothetical protein
MSGKPSLRFFDKYLVANTYCRIIQEICKGTHVHALCGPDQANLDVLLAAMNDLSLRSLTQDLSHLRALNWFRAGEERGRRGHARISMLEALLKSRYAHATDQHDKIYALLGLVRNAKEVAPVPDYTEPLEEVQSQLTTSIVVDEGFTSAILLASRVGTMNGSQPTWYPNWAGLAREDLPAWIVDHGCYDAGSERSANLLNMEDVLIPDKVLTTIAAVVADLPDAIVPVSASRDVAFLYVAWKTYIRHLVEQEATLPHE